MLVMSASLFMKMMSPPNPPKMAMVVLGLSLLSALILFKSSLSSWIPFIMIISFSSGMMTLFTYAATMTPNEKSKPSNPSKGMPLLLLMTMAFPHSNTNTPEKQNQFTMKTTMLFMTFVLILTMVTISNHGYNPQQTISSSF